MLSIQNLIYFMKIAELHSMNQAAEQLFISQPSLTSAIKSLEDDLNITIFTRSNKGVLLTEDGQKLYRYGQNILSNVELIENISQYDSKRFLSISSFPLWMSSHFFQEFYEQNKDSNLELEIEEVRISKVLSNVKDCISDIGLVQYNSMQTREFKKSLSKNQLEYHELIKANWAICIGPCHPLYNNKTVTISELLNYTFLREKDDYFSSITTNIIIDGIQMSNIKKIFINNGFTMLHMLHTTDAFAIVMDCCQNFVSDYNLKILPIENCNVKLSMGWIKSSYRTLNPDAENFINIIKEIIKRSI